MLLGPYLSERAWATVREDYSPDGEAWSYFPHEHARFRTYRWSEDGIGGVSDDKQHLCLAHAFWNGRDPILKERMFGLTGSEGNHGEDVKEAFFYLDSTPTHSYMRMNYKYPHAEFPYAALIEENRKRSRTEPEFELWDTGIFADDRYFDIDIEYAKASPEDLLCRITVRNMGPDPAPIHVLPTLWFRNTWSWGRDDTKPWIKREEESGKAFARCSHATAGTYELHADLAQDWLFSENETNFQHLYGSPNASPFTKDAFHRRVIHGDRSAVNPDHEGTKAAAVFHRIVGPGEAYEIRLRLLRPSAERSCGPFEDFDTVFQSRIKEADEFYAAVQPAQMRPDERLLQRQALAGMMWGKQFFHYIVDDWLEGDPSMPKPPESRKKLRNSHWRHLYNERVMSMTDPWEYPWYAAWDLAFHCVPISLIDPGFAKSQLDLLTREWYQHPNGQIPAYEWNFSDVNPPVFAWAAWRVYKMEEQQPPKAVMVTAHAEHAIQAFDIEAVDYLLKPVKPTRFAQAVQRLQAACAPTLVPNTEPTFSPEDHICLRTPQRTITVPVSDILVLQAEGDFTRIYLKNATPLMICVPLGQYEKLLPSPPFARLDRSLILNLQTPLNLRRKSRDEASLVFDKANHEIPLGRTAQQRLRDALKQSGNNATMQL